MSEKMKRGGRKDEVVQPGPQGERANDMNEG